MTPDEPETLGPPDDADHPASATSRADLQAELRKTRKKERKRRHRWRRRALYALSFVVLVAAAGVGGLYFYANYRFDQIKKIHAKHLVAAAPPGQPFNLLLVGSDSRGSSRTQPRSTPSATRPTPAASAVTSRWWPASTLPPRP